VSTLVSSVSHTYTKIISFILRRRGKCIRHFPENAKWKRPFGIPRGRGDSNILQYRQCTITYLLWRVRLPIVPLKRNISVCIVETTRHCQQYIHVECCTRMVLWRIYVAGALVCRHIDRQTDRRTVTKLIDAFGDCSNVPRKMNSK